MKTKEERAAIAAQANGRIIPDMQEFCKSEGITAGWSKENQVKHMYQRIKEVFASFPDLDDEDDTAERAIRIKVILNNHVNASQVRQRGEKAGFLTAGVKGINLDEYAED
jgi:hypothetical protein